MRVQLHDNYLLADPVSVGLLVGAGKKIDTYIKKKFGSWSGFNGFVLSIIGKHPATDPKKVDEMRNFIMQQNWTGVTLYKQLKALSNKDLIRLSDWLISVIGVAKAKSDKGDWVANRYLIVYNEMLRDTRDEMQARINAGTMTDQDTDPRNRPATQNPTTTNSNLSKLAIPLIGLALFS